jgi:hypothetical protein
MVNPLSLQRRWRSPNGTELLRQRRLVGAGRRLTRVGAEIPAPPGTPAPLLQAVGLRPPVHHSGVRLNSVPLDLEAVLHFHPRGRLVCWGLRRWSTSFLVRLCSLLRRFMGHLAYGAFLAPRRVVLVYCRFVVAALAAAVDWHSLFARVWRGHRLCATARLLADILLPHSFRAVHLCRRRDFSRDDSFARLLDQSCCDEQV